MSNSLRNGVVGSCALAVALMAGQAGAQTACGGSVGPDVIVGDLPATTNFSPVGGIDAYSMATTSCNVGNTVLLWNAFPSNTHPAITQNMYRFSRVDGSGRFEHIGMSWLKHGFTALTGNVCCTCQNPGNGSRLGVGCSDPYTAGRNASQSGLGPHWQVNAHTGVFPTNGPAGGTGGSGSIYRRLQFATTDVVATSGGSAAATRFFGESQYVAQDDAAAGNQNNNASHRELAISGTVSDWTVNFSSALGSVANTSRGNPAIRAWATCEPGVTLTNTQVPGDGLFIVGSKATDLGNGVWHYEYAVLNLNADRNGGSFSMDIDPRVTITNAGFSSPKYHDGDGEANINFVNAPWTYTKTANQLSWACETPTANIRANAIRWATTYNFRFDANVAPMNGEITLGIWKAPTAGSPATEMQSAAQIPGMLPCGSADFNGDGDIGTDADIEAFFACLAGNCCATCGDADFNADGDIGTDADIEAFFRVLGGGNC